MKQDPFATIRTHPFLTDALKRAALVHEDLGGRDIIHVNVRFKRDPDEHEYYILGVGRALAELVTCCEHLRNIPAFMTSYRETAYMKRAGINRHQHIVFHVENYIIRVQGLFDRVLKLLDAVFHLLNHEKNCRANVVLKNLKVRMNASVLGTVKKVEKLIRRYEEQRNEIIHATSFQEDNLRVIEMLFLMENVRRQGFASSLRDLSGLRGELIREFLVKKKNEFAMFNKELGSALCEVFNVLHPCYRKKEIALRLRLLKAD